MAAIYNLNIAHMYVAHKVNKAKVPLPVTAWGEFRSGYINLVVHHTSGKMWQALRVDCLLSCPSLWIQVTDTLGGPQYAIGCREKWSALRCIRYSHFYFWKTYWTYMFEYIFIKWSYRIHTGKIHSTSKKREFQVTHMRILRTTVGLARWNRNDINTN